MLLFLYMYTNDYQAIGMVNFFDQTPQNQEMEGGGGSKRERKRAHFSLKLSKTD